MLTAGAPRELEVGDVDAGDEQDEATEPQPATTGATQPRR